MMNTYISILRGINVGGKNKVRMVELRSLYENIGFKNVQSYIQSGNVVFLAKSTKPKHLEAQIVKEIQAAFGYDVSVIVRTLDVWEATVHNNPFTKDTEKEEKFLHVTFLSNSIALASIDTEKIMEKKRPGEEVSFSKKVVYLYCPISYGRTKLNNNFFERKLKTRATTRNWKTTKKLLKMAENLQKLRRKEKTNEK